MPFVMDMCSSSFKLFTKLKVLLHILPNCYKCFTVSPVAAVVLLHNRKMRPSLINVILIRN